MKSALQAEREPTAHGLDALLDPGSVAILGISDRRPTWGNRALRACAEAGFPGLHGVSPRAPLTGFAGIDIVPGLAEIPGPIDCALIAVSAQNTLPAVRACAEHGVRAAVLVGVGFGELGGGGAELQRSLAGTARAAGMRLLGPNCIGTFRARTGVCFMPFAPPAGSVALVTQSGNVAAYLSLLARHHQFGLSTCVGVGNQVDVSTADVLRWLAGDPETSTVAVYAEGLPAGTGDRFMAGLQACAAAGKPVIVLHGGETATGRSTAATHTGSLAGNAEVWRAVLDRAGAVQVGSVPELAEAIVAAETVPRFAGPVMVLTDGGGDSVLTVDALSRNGIPLARLGGATRRELAALLPPGSPQHDGLNPVTLDAPGGLQDDPMLLARCATAASRDGAVSALVIVGLFGGYSAHRAAELEAASRLIELRRSGLPVLVASAYDGVDEAVISVLRAGGIPVYASSGQLVSALATRVRQAGAGAEPAHVPVPASGEERGTAPVLPLDDARGRLLAAGIPVPDMRTVGPGGDLEAACQGIAAPWCVKLDLAGLTHKSDIGGVRLGLDLDGVRQAAAGLWSRYPQASLVVMPTFPAGFEMLVGITWDELFGAAVVVGRGGIWAEVEQDVAVIVQPATRADYLAAVSRLRCYPMIAGGRGQPPLDLSALADLLESMGGLAAQSGRVIVDLNPVILYERGLAVVDFVVDFAVADLDDHPAGGMAC
jgi:acetate---CoA ligase (ADP-forming)